jgi:hypothetical protein
MPGVVVTTAVRSGPSGVGDIESSQMFLAGEFQRGPTDEAKLVRSFSEFKTYYGEYTTSTTGWIPVKTFFEEGGSRAYIARAIGATPVAATGSLQATGALDTIDFTAADVGTWGNSLVIAANNDNIVGSGFRLTVTLDGELLLTTPELASVAAAISYINTSSVSHLVVASDNVASADNPIVGSVTLSSGADGSATTDASYNTALGLFTYELGAGVVCMPGQTSTTAYANMDNHATANNRIAFCAFANGTNEDDAKTNAAAAGTAAGDDARRMAFYHPHIKVEDPTDAGLTVTISPETFAAAARAKAINEAGAPFRAGAGLLSAASSYVKGVERVIDKAAGDLLDEARVNAIRSIGGSVRVYGARSLSTDEANWRFITFQDMVNHIVVEAEERLEDFVFSTIDSRGGLFGQIRSSMVAMLDPHRISGGLYEAFDSDGERIDPGYSVVVNDENNPVAQLASGLVKVDVGIRVSSVGDKIQVSITKSNLTASVV